MAYIPPIDPTNYGLHVPYDQGFGVTHGSHPTDSQQRTPNGRLVNQLGQAMRFYVEDMEASFGLGGNEAQSRRLKQFFPHSITQPTLMVSGRSTSSYEFNRLAAFIRQTHLFAINGRAFQMNGTKNFSPLVKFQLRSRDATARLPRTRANHKGKHVPWSVEGYVKTIKAGATAHEVAPEFAFEFIVIGAKGNGGFGIFADSFDDGDSTSRRILPWLDQFKKKNGPRSLVKPGPGYVRDGTLPGADPADVPPIDAPDDDDPRSPMYR